MARYHPSLYGRRREQIRRWMYIISALLVTVVVVVLIYSSCRGSKKDQIPETVTTTDVVKEVKQPVVAPPEPEPQPELELQPEPEPQPTTDLVSSEPASTGETSSRADELIAEATAYINAKPARIINARDILNDALKESTNTRQQLLIKKQLSELADKWLFSRTIFPEDKLCGTYNVEPGDQLRTIGKQYKVPWEILMDINKIPSAEALQAGDTIKVINGPFHVKIYCSTFTMDLYLQNTFVRSFPVGLGQPGMETPTGLWVVKPGGKLIKPTWTDPASGRTYEAEDPDYPLGSRWIGLEGVDGAAKGRTGFAIHGTKDPIQIGSASSRGCIRLHNGDAILIYNLLEPGFSQVKITE